MPQNYVANKNDDMESIAKKFGFGDYKVIYDHPQNAQLKQQRPKPNLLVEGDVVFVPDIELGEESCATEQKHTFELKRHKVKLRLVLKDHKGKPFGDKKYELKIDDKKFDGNTDGQGFVEQEVPADATSGKLTLFTEDEKLKVLSWDLSIGQLEPVETDDGVQGRLRNLGYYFGTLDKSVSDDESKDAIKDFQKDKSMTQNGDCNDQLRSTLRDEHDKK